MTTVPAFTAMLAACALSSGAAMADFNPAPSSGTMVGTLIVSQITTFNCDFVADYSVSTDGKKMMIANQQFLPGDPACSFLSPVGDWRIEDSGPDVGISVSYGSLFGSCSGTIASVAWNNVFGGFTLIGAGIPGTPSNCTVSGTLVTNPKVTYS